MRGEKILLLVLTIYFLSAIITHHGVEKMMGAVKKDDKSYNFFAEASRIMNVQRLFNALPYIPVFNSLFAISIIIVYAVAYCKHR